MSIKQRFKTLSVIFLLCNAIGCKKFLETKSIQTLTVPENLNDLQLLLDNPALQLGLNSLNTSTDEYYVSYTNWLPLTEINKNGYVWEPSLNSRNDWTSAYKSVFVANTVLFNLDNISDRGNPELKRNIKGMALFIRAHFFFLIAQQFAPQYDASTASHDPGIVLRLNADFNEVSKRSSVGETYQQIISDLETAVPLLPQVQIYKNRPGKAAGLGLLARVYLQIGEYEKAKERAVACLDISNSLIDYNQLPANATNPLGNFNANNEIIYYFKTSSLVPLNGDDSRARFDSVTYRSFGKDDLRKNVLFRDNGNGTFSFKGSYTGDKTLFNGIATDELYLIRAECWARLNNTVAALEDLNKLLKNRWASGTFVSVSATSSEEALRIILQERRKELIYRGVRWSDLKRLNKDSRFAMTIKRELNGQLYVLTPNDLRYAFLIPFEVVSMAGISQNPR